MFWYELISILDGKVPNSTNCQKRMKRNTGRMANQKNCALIGHMI
jgi:hypothetical protein